MNRHDETIFKPNVQRKVRNDRVNESERTASTMRNSGPQTGQRLEEALSGLMEGLDCRSAESPSTTRSAPITTLLHSTSRDSTTKYGCVVFDEGGG